MTSMCFICYSCILGRYCFRRGGPAYVSYRPDHRPGSAHAHAHTFLAVAHNWWVDSTSHMYFISTGYLPSTTHTNEPSATEKCSIVLKEVNRSHLRISAFIVLFLGFDSWLLCLSGGLGEHEHEMAKKRGSIIVSTAGQNTEAWLR